MAVFSSLTPVFVAVLCVIIGFLFKKSQRRESRSKQRSSGDTARPWVDEDLQDDTEISRKHSGIAYSTHYISVTNKVVSDRNLTFYFSLTPIGQSTKAQILRLQ